MVVSDDVSEMVVVPKTTSKPEAKTLPLSERLLAWFTMSKKKKGDENGAADEGEEEDPELVQLTTKKGMVQGERRNFHRLHLMFLASIGRIRKMAPGWFLALGGAGAILFGGVYPAFAIIFSKIIEVFFNPDAESVKTEASWIAFIFFALGLVLFIAQVVKGTCVAVLDLPRIYQWCLGYGLGVASSRLTFNLRLKAYRSVLSQEMKWFDEPNHNSKVIAGKMSRDCGMFFLRFLCFFLHFLYRFGSWGDVHVNGCIRGGSCDGVIWTDYCVYLPPSARCCRFGVCSCKRFCFHVGLEIHDGGHCKRMSTISMRFYFLHSSFYLMFIVVQGEKTFAAASRISANALSEVRTLASFTGEGPVLDEFSSELQKMMPVVYTHLLNFNCGSEPCF